MGNYSVGDLYPLSLTGLAIGGEAVGRLEDLVVFVPFGAPGDEVEVRLCEVKKNYARGEINRLIKSSPHRVQPPCPIFYKCGGCQLQQMTYESQLEYKRKMSEEVFLHLGGLHGVEVDTIHGCPHPFNYRNKMQVVAACKPFLHGNKVAAPYFGLYARHTHRVVRMDECAIQHPYSNQILRVAREVITKLQWEVYNEATGTGMLRYMVTRVSSARNESILVLVVTTPKVPGISEFVQAMTRKIPHLKGIVINVNDKRTNVVMGTHSRAAYGEEFIIEEVEDIKYRVSAQSFFQVNPDQTTRIFRILDQFIDPTDKDVILDAYCGVGAISLWLAKKARTVIGIEEVMQAKKDAMASAQLNGIANLEFHVGQVEKVLPEIYHRGHHRIDKLVLDPPRRGCEEMVLDLISRMRIPRIAYVSCNPATFARDLSILRAKGYHIDRISLVDMFPQTYHVEGVALLSYSPTTFIRRVKMETPPEMDLPPAPPMPPLPVREAEPATVEPEKRGPSYHQPKEMDHKLPPRKQGLAAKPMTKKLLGDKVLTRRGIRREDLLRKAPDTADLEDGKKEKEEFGVPLKPRMMPVPEGPETERLVMPDGVELPPEPPVHEEAPPKPRGVPAVEPAKAPPAEEEKPDRPSAKPRGKTPSAPKGEKKKKKKAARKPQKEKVRKGAAKKDRKKGPKAKGKPGAG